MVEIKESLLEALLEEAINEANIRQSSQMVSMTEKIDEMNPIDYFEAAKVLDQDRVFWSSTAEDFYIVGVGNSFEICANESRFQETERQWNELLATAMIDNPYEVPGTGVLALGGMSFDPKRNPSYLWDRYQSSQFIVPKYMLTKHNGAYYFTVTVQVEIDDDYRQLSRDIDREKQSLFESEVTFPTGASIVAKEEVKKNQWLDIVDQAIEAINNDKAKKIVLAREMRLQLNKSVEIGVMLKKLLHLQTNSYIFAVERGENCFIGATPERLVSLAGNKLLSACVAGTAPRGRTIVEDDNISNSLLHDDKNREEHGYVVKMIRQAMEQYCKDIDIPSQPVIYPLKNLQHLYTPVTAILKEGYSIFDVIEQLHPTPALGGVPREASLAFIREHECFDRGWYGAPIGWLDSNKHAEFAVAIRSGLIQGDEASLFAGCGIMKDSDPTLEYEETNIKFLPILSALEEHDESH